MGVLSCLLLIESFSRFKGGPAYGNWKIEKDIIEDNNIKKEVLIQKSYLTSLNILKSIAYHSMKRIVITDSEIPYFWVCLVDDLVEQYRPTRAGKVFILSNICNVKIPKADSSKICVRYDFENENNDIDNIIHFFIHKIERYYYILDMNFKFTIEVKIKEKDILMKYHYQKKKDSYKKVRKILLYKNKFKEPKEYNEEELEKFLMKELKERKKEIGNFFEENNISY